MTRPGDIEVSVAPSPQGDATVVRVDGDLDMATVPELEEALSGADLGGRLVIDLAECTFLDSSAVRVLVATARAAEAAGGDVALVTSDTGILRVLAIASVETMLPVYDTVESAAITQRTS